MKSLLLLSFLLLAELTILAQPMQERIFWQERPRKFITFLPEAYEPGNEEQLPLVLNLHPFLTDGAFQMWYTRFNGLADAEGAIVVYPYGIQRRWNSGSYFTIPQPIDDVGFLNALIDYMAVKYNIDTRRVFATGYSNGGYMSYRLGCEITNRLGAIAPVAGSMNPDTYDACAPQRPLPTLIMHGTADPVVLYSGMPGIATAQEDNAALWSMLNGCDPEPVITDVPNSGTSDGTTAEKWDYQNCDDGSEVVFYKFNNGGHTWPGRNFPLLGNTSQDVIANETIWEFFQRHPIPEDIACDRPTGLAAEFDNGIATLTWEEVPGIDIYSVLFFDPDGQLEIVNDVPSNSYQVPVAGSGELAWMVRAQCGSGHASWSAVNRDEITGRMAGGRMALLTYPNPASDELFLELDRSHIPSYVSIIDAYGSVVRTIRMAPEQASVRLDISWLDDGIYHLVTSDQSYEAQSFRKW